MYKEAMAGKIPLSRWEGADEPGYHRVCSLPGGCWASYRDALGPRVYISRRVPRPQVTCVPAGSSWAE